MKKIGLTGNIASGKSTASRRLAQLGAEIIDADLISRQLTQPGQQTWLQIKEVFGDAYFRPDGTLDRKALGAFVFHDANALKQLNAISHEAIRQVIRQRLHDCVAPVAVVDAALLIEGPLREMVDEIWLVTAPDDLRCSRIMTRDGLTEQQARDRIASQLSQEEKTRYAQEILVNDGAEESFWHRWIVVILRR